MRLDHKKASDFAIALLTMSLVASIITIKQFDLPTFFDFEQKIFNKLHLDQLIILFIAYFAVLFYPIKKINDLFFKHNIVSDEHISTHLRGAQMLSEKELAKITTKATKNENDNIVINLKQKNKNPIFLPKDYENRHHLVIGAPGGGKSVFLKNFIYQLLTRQGADEKIIIYDRKPEFVQNFNENDLIFAPQLKGSILWSPLLEVKDRGDIKFLIDNLIHISTDDKQPIFKMAAKMILELILLYLLDRDELNQKKFIDFLRQNQDIEALKETLKDTSFKYGLSLDPYLAGGSSGFTASILGSFITYVVSPLVNEAFYFDEDDENIFSIKKYLNTPHNRNLFVINDNNMEAANSSYLVLFFAFLNREILSLENDTNRRIWLFLDEFQTLKTSAGTGLWSIYNLMAEGRQKGASVVIATQSLSQMKLIYGTDGLNSLLSLTSNKYFFQIHDTADQEIVTKLLGKQESKDFQVSTREGNFGGMDNDSFNLGYSVKERSMILPNELSQLKVVVDDRIEGDIVLVPDFKSYQNIYSIFGKDRYKTVTIKKG
jgi:type IV secretory pathway TraG/TraD family ATPase VirD4